MVAVVSYFTVAYYIFKYNKYLLARFACFINPAGRAIGRAVSLAAFRIL